MRLATKTWSMPTEKTAEAAIPCTVCGGLAFKLALRCEGFSFVACRNCGLLQRNPQPLPQDICRRYQERYGNDYLEYELANEETYRHLQVLGLTDLDFPSFENDLLSRPQPPHCLDIGCASGALLDWLRHRGWKTTGVELCRPSAAYARGRGLDVRDGRLEDCQLESASFDLIHASHLIEHLNDPRQFLKTVRRLIKANGYLILSSPNADGFQAKLFGSGWRSAIFDHLYLFGKRQLISLLESEAFSLEKIITWGGLAAGTAPPAIKDFADRLAKSWGWGDVMALRLRPLC